jgi:hypothetical protein
MSAPQEKGWTDANQDYLVAEFARLKALLAGQPVDRQTLTTVCASLPGPSALDGLCETFGLTGFERELLLLCAGVEMDARLARLCAEGQGQAQRPYVTFGLALGALQEPHWSAITPVRPLRRWRLLELEEGSGLSSARLRIDERILHFLAGINYLDSRLQPMLRETTPVGLMATSHGEIVERIVRHLQANRDFSLVIQLTGADRSGQEDVAAAVCERLGLQSYTLDAQDIPGALHDQEAFTVLWERESWLLGAALLLRVSDFNDGTQRFVARLGGPVFLAARDALPVDRQGVRHEVRKPDPSDQRILWEQALGAATGRLNGALDGVAAQFSFSARGIATIGSELRPELDAETEPDARLWRACRGMDGGRLERLAQRVEPSATWDDLILPEGQINTLYQVAAHVRHRLKVYEEWGFSGKGARGLGISALFAGESGTGKTMAAEVLANELNLDLYRIDLSGVVSKYIGETEKNLRRVFDAAEETGAILLFDEADALFGKRSEVKDSHDRYANIEVSYLLQRMEAYRGLAVLTTNHKKALDPAFQRRLRFVIPFPFPDAAQREAIWRSVFPPQTPVQDVGPAMLARLNVAGGSIHNIAMQATFLAAEADTPVTMAHLLQAAHIEAAKREKPLTDAETRGWV